MPPLPPSEFVALILEALAPLGTMTAQRMFGGYCLRCDGLTFALVADEVLYFKVDDQNRPAYEALGLRAFKPFDDKPMVMSYYPVPEAALDDSDVLVGWARPALEVAYRAQAAKPARKRAPRRKKEG